jgi:8-oxo-dGTP pyrophosphatase MutT (NUDIX family)
VSRDALIVQVDCLDGVLENHDWRFAKRHADDIDAHWRKRTQLNSTLYDGRVLLARRYEDRLGDDGRSVMSIGFFEASFSRFLAWRDFDFPDVSVYNCFAMAAVRSADGAYLLGEMNSRHSSPGAVYFPSGTPDLTDVRGAVVDLEGSVLRELAEETGVSPDHGGLEPGWTIVFERQYIACVKTIASREPAAALLAGVKEYLVRQKDPELAAAHMISRRGELADPRLMSFVRAFLEPLLPE